MPRTKLKRLESLSSFPNVLEKAQTIKGRWRADYFKNENPITLELACGKGEYTIELARRFPQQNFIGVDIKGARLWRGAQRALELNLRNAAFLRIKIDNIIDYFAEREVDEIWLTFPDPFPKSTRGNRRLTSPKYLELYRRILKPDGVIHLKTDNPVLYFYTREVLQSEGMVQVAFEDLYSTQNGDPILTIQTTYEKKFLAEGVAIKYLKFSFPHK
jgi:tRNA (guanine-N7-)-methyltransferase